VKRARFVALAALLGVASLYVGLRVGSERQALAVHPLTGRPIAGIATDAAWMDRVSRNTEESPDRALSLIGLQQGMTVADVGAGSGYMTLRLASMVGPAGKVYANDIQPRLLGMVQDKARAQGLTNIEIVLGSDTDAKLPDNAIDVALLVDVYHEFQHPREMLRSIRRSLKPGGRLVLIEYRKEDVTIPIAPTHRMTVADGRREVEAEGFTFERVVPDLPRQHIIIFRI
jgi:ubiquinone/menaquinone biosynthesis C-methylase UbiE